MKIGLLTSGGDCQGLNAALRGVAKASYELLGADTEFYGFIDGYKGLISGEVKKMTAADFSGILTLGGTILGTSRQPFKNMRVTDENNVDKVPLMMETYRRLGLDCIVILGGNGTHKTANLLSNEGLNVITLPKTIDNDIFGTDITFGFQSAVDIASDVVDRIHTTAASHSRTFVIELMGNKAGWLTLHAGIAGSADVILIPEIPYDPKNLVAALERRQASGKHFSIIVVAEGAVSVDEAKLEKRKDILAARNKNGFPSVAYMVAAGIEKAFATEIRVAVPGHYQRGGSPCAYDKVLATALGTAGAQLISQRKFGNMVGVVNGNTVPVPLSKVAGVKKPVTKDHYLVRAARNLGVSLGD